MTDKRQKATKVKCKHDESLTKQPIFVEYSRNTQYFTKIDQEKHKIEQIYIWNLMTTGFIM